VLRARGGQHRQRRADGEEHPAQIDVEVAVEHRRRQLRERHAAAPVGRRVDEHVHSPVRGLVRRHDPCDGLLVADVPRCGLHRAAQLLRRRRELGGVAPRDGDRVALLDEHAGERLPDPAPAAGDQGCSLRHRPTTPHLSARQNSR
jgi:hypothetical protein